jgi:hypothetical protein
MEQTPTDPAEFIASLPDEVRADVEHLDSAISEVMSSHTKTMWEGKFWGGTEQNIIGYANVSYERPGGAVEWFMVGLAPQKSSISVYVNAVDDDGYLVEQYADRLGKARVGKAAINFKTVADINLDVLLQLVAEADAQVPSV